MASLPLELSNNYLLDNLKQDIESLLSHVKSASWEFLVLVTIILWAGIQRRLLVHLTATLSRRRWNDVTRGYEDPTIWYSEHDYRPSERGREDSEYLHCILLYVSMYIGFFDAAGVPAKTLLTGLAISSVPLFLPFRFYLEWPLVSKTLLMWWAKVTLAETVSWTGNALSLAFSISSMCQFLEDFAQLSARRLEAPEQPHPNILAATWKLSFPKLKDTLPRVWRDWFLESVLN
ncbi:hypothetical protein BBK36DRAFT_1159258 [Trichoderma citrinoviride]|uniref:Uncharacterized protein n=1 Tax=Trichoderma citrinoviride TaxID=58853 RepID=A0A2T4BAH4_9HYPO|nr:hypothetical protein BBK36DRAFT_1159258 [Trichoderma citrinoviride]PTB66209.1 hypothetical protein BBK36DRAFT_1159258 [Trichoderma citrinoviride]